MLTATKGTAMLNTIFSEYGPWSGPIATRENGSLTAHEQGQVTSYALESIQQRGKLFCGAGDQVYEDQVVGIHQRNNDLKVNVCKKKQVTNIRRWAAVSSCCVGVLSVALAVAGVVHGPKKYVKPAILYYIFYHV